MRTHKEMREFVLERMNQLLPRPFHTNIMVKLTEETGIGASVIDCMVNVCMDIQAEAKYMTHLYTEDKP